MFPALAVAILLASCKLTWNQRSSGVNFAHTTAVA
jgi:hypothetical protein